MFAKSATFGFILLFCTAMKVWAQVALKSDGLDVFSRMQEERHFLFVAGMSNFKHVKF